MVVDLFGRFPLGVAKMMGQFPARALSTTRFFNCAISPFSPSTASWLIPCSSNSASIKSSHFVSFFSLVICLYLRLSPAHKLSDTLAISEINKKLDTELGRFARRELDSEYPYLILDARYEKLRENGVIRSRAVLVAIGIDWEGRRQVLGVEMANRESATSWKDFLLGLKRRGLRGVVFAVSDDHPGLKRAIMEVLPEAFWQRCYVHFLRNALDHLPRKIADDCLVELRWLYDRRNAEEVRRDLAAWLLRWQEKYRGSGSGV